MGDSPTKFKRVPLRLIKTPASDLLLHAPKIQATKPDSVFLRAVEDFVDDLDQEIERLIRL